MYIDVNNYNMNTFAFLKDSTATALYLLDSGSNLFLSTCPTLHVDSALVKMYNKFNIETYKLIKIEIEKYLIEKEFK